jgi:hypothetical protein
VDSDEGNSNESSSSAGYLAEKTNWKYNWAEEEYNTFESFKHKKYRPKWVKAKSEILSGIGLIGDMEEIIVGPVEENGKDLPLGKKWETMWMRRVQWTCLSFLKNTRSTSLPCGS